MRIAVYAVVKQGDKVLTVTNTTGTFLPGGGVEINEPLAQTLKREIREELGCTCEIGEYIGAVKHRFHSPKLNKEVEQLSYFYSAVLKGRPAALSPDGTGAVQWAERPRLFHPSHEAMV